MKNISSITLVLVVLLATVLMVSAIGENRNYIQNLKNKRELKFNNPASTIDGLVQHLGSVLKGYPSKLESISSLDLFERPLVGIVLSPSKSNEVNDVIVKKIQNLFGKDSVATVSSLKEINFAVQSGVVVVTHVENIENEMKMAPERSEVVVLNLEKNLQVMTPAQRLLMSVYDINNTTTNSTNVTVITDFERADYQMQLWVWVFTIVCVILAIFAVNKIDYSADQMLYALEMTKSHHD